MKKYILPYCILIALVLAACNKNNERHIPIDADVLANFNYKVGTYWIYRDSLSGQVDSFYVSDNGGIVSSDQNGILLDAIGMIIRQKNISTVPGNDTIEWDVSLISNYLSLQLQIGKSGQPTDIVVFGTFITYPFVVGQPIPNGPGAGVRGANVGSILPSYTLNAHIYTNVAVLAIVNSNPQYNYSDQFFINADAGIIKMELNHYNDGLLRNWELLRYKIVR